MSTKLHESQIDHLLSTFFKAELPQSWPGLQLPMPEMSGTMPVPMSRTNDTKTTPESTRPIHKSRTALALSVALLLGGCWVLSEQFDTKPAPKAGIGLTNEDSAKNPYAKPAPSKTDKAQLPTMP